jgi:hypothetical protein
LHTKKIAKFVLLLTQRFTGISRRSRIIIRSSNLPFNILSSTTFIGLASSCILNTEREPQGRVAHMSCFYGIPLPPNFEDTQSGRPNAKRLTDVRNQLIHEARWGGQPLGYIADSASWDLLMNLKHFNSQLLLAVLGVECEFRRTLFPWQTAGLDVTSDRDFYL